MLEVLFFSKVIKHVAMISVRKKNVFFFQTMFFIVEKKTVFYQDFVFFSVFFQKFLFNEFILLLNLFEFNYGIRLSIKG